MAEDGMTIREVLNSEKDSEAEVIEIDEDRDPTPEESVRDALHIGEGVDPVAAFLDVDTTAPITDEVAIKRLGISVTVRAITDDREYERIVDRCTTWVKARRGGRTKELDGTRLSKLIVANFTVNPPFAAKNGKADFEKLAQKYGTNDPEILVERALLIGEIDAISDKIMTISGFEDDYEVVGN